MMIPTRYDYYKQRAREHRRLSRHAGTPEDRASHATLVSAYVELARGALLRQVVKLKV